MDNSLHILRSLYRRRDGPSASSYLGREKGRNVDFSAGEDVSFLGFRALCQSWVPPVTGGSTCAGRSLSPVLGKVQGRNKGHRVRCRTRLVQFLARSASGSRDMGGDGGSWSRGHRVLSRAHNPVPAAPGTLRGERLGDNRGWTRGARWARGLLCARGSAVVAEFGRRVGKGAGNVCRPAAVAPPMSFLFHSTKLFYPTSRILLYQKLAFLRWLFV